MADRTPPTPDELMAAAVALNSTQAMFARAFAEWDRRWREDPEGFVEGWQRVQAGETTEEYGESAARYFRSLIADTRA